MKRLALCPLLVACTRDANEAPRPVDTSHPVAGERTVKRRGAVTTTPRQLFEDFTRPDDDGIVLLDKYRDGATFTATIKTIGVDEAAAPVVWIDIDGDNVMSLDFASPAPQGLQAGTQLTVTCKIDGASGALMMMTACRVRDL